MVKCCKKCGSTKYTEDFNKSSRTQDKLQTQCRTCQQEANKKWKELNQEHTLKYRKEYYRINKKAALDYGKEYYKLNQESRLEYAQNYRKSNPEYLRNYYHTNKEGVIKEYNKSNKKKAADKAYYQNNKKERSEYQGKYKKQRRTADPAFKLIQNLRARHNNVLKGNTSTTKGLGCDSTFFQNYISAQWTEGMSWDNYGVREGQWSIDHILPLTLYYTQPELLQQLIHYTNMQPMWHVDNVRKGKKVASN
jgi:hypothetical protein